MNTPSRAGFRWLACLSAALFALVAATSVAMAGPLEKYTGYTRIGHPPSPKDSDKKEKPAVFADQKTIGVTIYFMVLDRKTGRKGAEGDSWGVGIKNFDSFFVSGRNNDLEKLDADARYLYLYQIVNDREGTKAAIKDVTVRIVVDPRLITSWGFFRIREQLKDDKVAIKGVGFTMDFLDPKEKEEKYVVRPISTLFAGISDKRYQNPAPAIEAPRPYGITAINVGKVRDVADEADVGKAPEDVLLVPNADFGAPPKGDSVYLAPARTSDQDKLPSSDDLAARKRIDEMYRNRWPAIRAYWRDPENQIKPRQRSTIFGFTSDLPPTLEAVSVGGRGMGIGFGKLENPRQPPALAVVNLDNKQQEIIAGPPDDRRFRGQRGEGADATPAISGTLPTPAHPKAARATPPKEKTSRPKEDDRSSPAPVSQTVSSQAASGDSFPTSTSSGGGGLLAGSGNPGFGGGSGLGGLGSGGGGLGGGSGGQSSSPAPDTAPKSSNTMVSINNTSVAVANQAQSQSQSQAQGQAQAQKQSQGQGQKQTSAANGNVVPGPPAWLLGVLGLPILFLFVRRKPASRDQSPPNESADEPRDA